MIKGIEGVAFDLDGTLYPNYRLNVRLLPFILKEARLLISFGKARKIIRREQENDSSASYPKKDFYKYQAEKTAELLSVEAQPLQEKIERLIYRGWEPLFKKVKMFSAADTALIEIKKAGYKMGILSDFPLVNKLEYLKISHFWDAALCSEELGVIKPHRLPFDELSKAMSLPPEKIIYVGNSHPYDVAGASRVGMKTAWIRSPLSPGKGSKIPKPDFSFSNYRQFINFMLN